MRGCVPVARAWAIKGAGCAQPVSPSALQMSLGAGCPIPRASDRAKRGQQRGRGSPCQGTTICAKSRRADRLGDARTACPSAPSAHPPHRLCALSPFAGLGCSPRAIWGAGAWASPRLGFGLRAWGIYRAGSDRLSDARPYCPSAPSSHPPHRLCALSPFAGLGCSPRAIWGAGAWASPRLGFGLRAWGFCVSGSSRAGLTSCAPSAGLVGLIRWASRGVGRVGESGGLIRWASRGVGRADLLGDLRAHAFGSPRTRFRISARLLTQKAQPSSILRSRLGFFLTI